MQYNAIQPGFLISGALDIWVVMPPLVKALPPPTRELLHAKLQTD